MLVKKTIDVNLGRLLELVIEKRLPNEQYYTSKNAHKIYITSKDELIIICDPDEISAKFPLSELFTVTLLVNEYQLNEVIPRTLVENIDGIYREQHYKAITDLPFYESHFKQYENVYVVNEDNTHTLIWHDGKLVELNGEK